MFKNDFLPEEPLMGNCGHNFKEGNNNGWFHRKTEETWDKELIAGIENLLSLLLLRHASVKLPLSMSNLDIYTFKIPSQSMTTPSHALLQGVL